MSRADLHGTAVNLTLTNNRLGLVDTLHRQQAAGFVPPTQT